MNIDLKSVALAGVFALALGGAAGAQVAQIPTPANPSPDSPIATNGTPLPRDAVSSRGGALYSGRSAFAPVDGVVGTGLGIAGGAVDTGLNTAGAVVNGGVGTAEDIVR